MLDGLKALAQGAQLTFLAYLIGIAVEEAQEEKSRRVDKRHELLPMALHPAGEVSSSSTICTSRAPRPVVRMSSSMSTGLRPSALTMRSGSFWPTSGRGLGGAFVGGGGLDGLGRPSQNWRERFHDVAGGGDESRTLLEQVIGAGRARVERAARQGKDIASLLARQSRRDQRARALTTPR
jgi:hypothetical protein